ncbi:MAG: acylphosphatase [Reichenbachiella sp.]|uniref:acylphosphatase n=1 Tax=Reichenbachiella sp. TaxID=2184521 RepID=UPI003266BD22
MNEVIGRSIIVTGDVQGVFYRASTKEQAWSLKLNGWVKNLISGQVQIEVFGSEPQVTALIDWCKSGPPMANVTAVQIAEIPVRLENSFNIIY